ncbi:FAD binding domain protein [Hypoxylon sp. FL0543]|nr:FAD binding domain protein [Hypoxylon sp. FL0543]
MEIIPAAVAWALSSTCQNIPGSNWLGGLCPRGVDASELSARLSSTAQVYFPGSDGYTQATTRWSVLDAPGVNVAVVPGVEDDVAEIVKYANEKKMPFLAQTGGHGAITTVGKMQNGIEIWMDQLSSVKISEDANTATVGGGTLSKTVTDALWAAGKQTVTGGCECTSILGPALGGGHGFLQGRHGLISDQLVSLNMVLADGTKQTVDKNSDLWWAVQGAGHNFGIVTSATLKIYDVQYRDWAYASFLYTGDKVEGLYDGINKYLLKNGTQSVDVINYSFFFNSPAIDPTKPVIMFYILQEGVTAVDATYTAPFQALGPVATDAAGGSYTDLPAWTGNANTSPPCQKAGLVNVRFPIDVDSYNIDAQRKAYDLFASTTQQTPALNNSLFLFEGYSLQGVKAVPQKSTAFPFRGDNLLLSPLITYAPAGPDLDQAAAKLGNDLRQILYEGSGRSELHTYVNYAFGDETTKNWYGYEQWRQDRLLELKNKYDPSRKFSFYGPIA